jgi:hypothetical protein
MLNTTFGGLRPLAAATLVASLGCGSDLALPDPSGATYDLRILDGDGQTGPVGEALDRPLVVKVVADGGQPVSGRKVAFVLGSGAAGRLDPDTSETNDEGEAVAQWVLGTVPGEQAVEARLVTDLESPPATLFRASAIAAAPDTLRALGAVARPGRRGETLEEPLVVIAVDRFGNPVPGIRVEWEVTVGEGQVSAEETDTGADGTASVLWTLGGRIGVQRATASIDGVTGSPVSFSATVLF